MRMEGEVSGLECGGKMNIGASLRCACLFCVGGRFG